MKIISYNVNGLRAALKKGLADWLQQQEADVICMQETKLQEEQFDADLFKELGYHSYLSCAQKKGYSGVAILSRQEPDAIYHEMGMPDYDQEGRYLRADYGGLSVLSVYFPSGSSGELRQAFKMKFLSDFFAFNRGLRQERPKLVICGDYNICHQEIDIHDPVRNATVSGFLPEEREWMEQLFCDGITDAYRYLHPQQKDVYTWWSYRTRARSRNKGWRIDYCGVSEALLPELKDSFVLSDAVHSDHCPTGILLSPSATAIV